VNRRILRELTTDVLQLRFLLEARDGDPYSLPSGDALLQRRVVERAAQSKHTHKRLLLLKRGIEFVLVRFAYRLLVHSELFRLIRTESDMPGLLAKAHTRLTA